MLFKPARFCFKVTHENIVLYLLALILLAAVILNFQIKFYYIIYPILIFFTVLWFTVFTNINIFFISKIVRICTGNTEHMHQNINFFYPSTFVKKYNNIQEIYVHNLRINIKLTKLLINYQAVLLLRVLSRFFLPRVYPGFF